MQIFGCINADSSVHSGSGFDVDKLGVGTYKITYEKPFNEPPAVLLTQNFTEWNDFGYGGGDTRDNCVLVAGDRHKCKVVTGSSDGKHDDRNFSFLAIGN